MSFADVVALVIGYLTPVVDPVPISSRVPKPRPDEFVRIRKIGGVPPGAFRETARLDVFTWAPQEPRAYEIANQIQSALFKLKGSNALGIPSYSMAPVLSPRTFDDPETGTPRVWATYDLVVRADDVIPYSVATPPSSP